MLQYIINTSIIWLAGLLLYEWLLCRESFHQYNRLLLLVFLAAGLLLPLAKTDSLMPARNHVLRQSAERAYVLKETVLAPVFAAPAPSEAGHAAYSAAAPAKAARGYGPILWGLYLAGALVGLLFVAREAFHLLHLYAAGVKSYEHGCRIIETGSDHGPFSFFNLVFVKSRAAYSDAQWTLIMAHEKEHSRQLHSLDNVLLIALRIVFWVHPLPHLYYKRLRTVHEFQADRAAAADTTGYGNFLIEQSLLRGGSVLTHSINRSPIKSRIAMLTEKRSPRPRLLKYLAALPLAFMLVLLCTQTSLSRKRSSSNTAYFRNNEVKFDSRKAYPVWYLGVLEKQRNSFVYPPLPDSIPVGDVLTGTTKMIAVRVDTIPVTLNGEPIFGNEAKYKPYNHDAAYTAPVFENASAAADIEQYLLSQLQTELNALENGVYVFDVSNVVVDRQGNIAYYEAGGIRPIMAGGYQPVISDELQKSIDHKIAELLDHVLKCKPALKDGKPVNVRLETGLHVIEVYKHKARLSEQGGC